MIRATLRRSVVIISMGYSLLSKARFDVVTVISNRDKPQVEIIKNAFELAYA